MMENKTCAAIYSMIVVVLYLFLGISCGTSNNNANSIKPASSGNSLQEYYVDDYGVSHLQATYYDNTNCD